MKICDPKCIFTWNLRRKSEPDIDYCPEVTDSVRKIWQGLSGIMTIYLEDEKDPVIIIWDQNVSDLPSGYMTDELYHDVRDDVSGTTMAMMTSTETVNQIIYNNGVVELFTKYGKCFHLVGKKLYRVR